MGLPFTRDMTLSPSTPFPSELGNKLQDWLVWAWEALHGRGFLLVDDFTGDEVSDTVWRITAGMTTGNDDVTPRSDSGFGCCIFNPAEGASHDLRTRLLPAQNFDFAFYVRIYTKVVNADGPMHVGFASGSEWLYLSTNPTTMKWQYKLESAAAVDTDVDVVTDRYVDLVARRTGSDLVLMVDGEEVYAGAFPTFTQDLYFNLRQLGGTGTTSVSYVDVAKLWVDR